MLRLTGNMEGLLGSKLSQAIIALSEENLQHTLLTGTVVAIIDADESIDLQV